MKQKDPIYAIIIVILLLVIVFLSNEYFLLKQKANPILLSEKFARERTYDLINYNCINYTKDYATMMQSNNYTVVTLELNWDDYTRHRMSCILIEPQYGEFVKNFNKTISPICYI